MKILTRDQCFILLNFCTQADLTNVKHAVQYFKDLFGDEIADKSSLYSIIRTCSGFKVRLKASGT